MTTPFVAYGNDALKNCPTAKHGDKIICDKCGQAHELMEWKDIHGNTSGLFSYICGDGEYLAAVGGKLITGVRPDMSGEL